MQSPDVNVLVSAFRADSEHHVRCRGWLDDALSQPSELGLSELVLSGVLRILTHPRVFQPPTPIEPAVDFVDALLAQPTCVRLRPGASHWPIFRAMFSTMRLTGNRIPDAYHAALMIEHGCEWVTLDRGFSAYMGLRSVNLLDEV